MELLLHLMTGHFDRCADKLEVFSSLSLAMVEVDFWCGIHASANQTREMDTTLSVSVSDHK